MIDHDTLIAAFKEMLLLVAILGLVGAIYNEQYEAAAGFGAAITLLYYGSDIRNWLRKLGI